VTGSSPREVTALLRAWRQGDAVARDRLVPLVYDQLRKRAAQHLRRARAQVP
jgi:ECF sigma factor